MLTAHCRLQGRHGSYRLVSEDAVSVGGRDLLSATQRSRKTGGQSGLRAADPMLQRLQNTTRSRQRDELLASAGHVPPTPIDEISCQQ